MHLELRRKGGSIPDSKGKIDNSQVNEKEQSFGKEIFARPPRKQ